MFLGQVPFRVGQAPGDQPPSEGTLMVAVIQDGLGVPGIPVGVLYEDGSEDEAATDPEGHAFFSFGNKKYGQAVVSITPHECCEAVPSNSQAVTLSSSPSQAVFSMVRKAFVEPEGPPAALVVGGLAGAGVLAWLLLA